MARLATPALYKKDMYKVKFEMEGKVEAKMRHKQILKYVPSATGAGDKETQLLGLGDLERHTTEGQDINFVSPAQGWEFLTKFHTYSKGVKLTFEAGEDSTKIRELLRKLAKTWTESSIDARETLAARVFNEGGTLSGDFVFNGSYINESDSSGDLVYDSKPFFVLSGNEYTKKDGSTYFNSVAGLTLDVDNFETIYNLHAATNAYNELGRPTIDPVDTLLTQRGADHQRAKRIQRTTRGLPGGELNDINVWEGTANPVDWAYLTDTQAFYVGKAASDDLQFIQRMSGSFDYFGDHDNRGSKASYVERIGIWVKGRPFSRGGGASAA